jgi:hypothetical protein
MAAPTVEQSSPANAATGVAKNLTFTFTGTDGDADDVNYNILVATDSGFTYTVIDAVSGTDDGFPADPPYASGEEATYAVQSNLRPGQTYYWKVRAIDPSGGNEYGAYHAAESFTVVRETTITTDLNTLPKYYGTGKRK